MSHFLCRNSPYRAFFSSIRGISTSVRGFQQASTSSRTTDGGGDTRGAPLQDSQPEIDRTLLKSKLSVKQRFAGVEDPFGVQDMVTVKDLLEARVHFGHKAGMWNKRIKPYLYGTRNGVHIFNLNTTLRHLHRALNVAGHVAYQRGVILFVNERGQFEALTMQTALQCREYYVTSWVPGTLTNSYKLLHTLRVPDLMVFLSVPRSKTAVKEANTYGIPSVGVVDSDSNPNFILYPVPGNDDSPQAVKLYSDLFCEVISRAKDLREEDEQRVMEELRMEAEKRKAQEAEQALSLEKELDSIYGTGRRK